jgi:putative PIN family toxin of toxin-antitoxin system
VIRAVVDPGVLVSAFIGRQGSVPDRIVRAWRAGRIELVVSPALLDELSDVLARPKFAGAAREGRAMDFVGALRVGASTVSDQPGTEAITRDPKDDYLVRLARSSAATALVSGDRDLLEANIGDVEVLTPRAFIDRVDASEA